MNKTDNQFLFIFIFIVMSLLTAGWVFGYTQRGKDEDRWECEFEYGNSTYNEIPLDCLKIMKLPVK